MRLMTVLLSTTLLTVASMATAQTQAVPAASSAKMGKHDPNRMVCKTLPTTGSRLKPNRDCRTVAQWEEAQALDRRDIDRLQTNRPLSGN